MPSSVLICCGEKGVQSWKLNSSGIRSSSALRIAGEASSCSFGSSGALLAVGGNDGKIAIRDSARGSLVSELRSSSSRVRAVCMAGSSPKTACSGHDDGMLKVWDVPGRKVVAEYAHRSPVVSCAFRKGDDYLAYGCGTQAMVLSLTSGTQICKLGMSGGGVTDVEWSSFRRGVLAATSDAGDLRVWDIMRSEKPFMTVDKAHAAPATRVRFSPVNHLLFSTAGLDNRVRFYDLRVKKPIKQLKIDGPVRGVDFHANGYRVAAATSRGTIPVFDLRTGGDVPAQVAHANDPTIMQVAFRPTSAKVDQSMLSTASPQTADGSARPTDKRKPRTGSPHDVLGALFSPPVSPMENGLEATILQDEESVCIPAPKKLGVAGTPVLAQASPNLISSRPMGTPSALKSRESKFDKENVGRGTSVAGTPLNRVVQRVRLQTPETRHDKVEQPGSEQGIVVQAPVPPTPSPATAGKPAGERPEPTASAAGNALSVPPEPLRPHSWSPSPPSVKAPEVPAPDIATPRDQRVVPAAVGPPRSQQLTVPSLGDRRGNPEAAAASADSAPTSGRVVDSGAAGGHQTPSSAESHPQPSPAESRPPATPTAGTATDRAGSAAEFQEALLKRCFEDAVSSTVGDFRSDLRNVHLEVIRGFHESMSETQRMIDQQGQMYQNLWTEVEALRTENRSLREQLYR